EPDKIVITVRSVALSCHFQNVEAKFCLNVFEFALLVGDKVSVSFFEAGIQNGNRAVRAQPVALIVRGIVRKRTQGEGILVEIPGVPQEGNDEITAADIVRQVAEKMAAIRVVTHVLNDGAAVRISLRRTQLLGCCAWKALKQRGLKIGFPCGIDDRLVRK